MRLGIFTDSHYCKVEVLCKTRRPSLSLKKIAEAMDAFQAASVDFCVCLGDLIDVGTSKEDSLKCCQEAIALIVSYGIPYRVIPGNHDYTVFSAEKFSEITECPIPPYTIETDSHILVFLDASYRSDNRRFDIAGVDWKDSNLPPFQLAFLKNILNEPNKPCIVLLHECLDSDACPNHRVKNADAIRTILEDSQKVKLVLQGHYHNGADRIENGIRYLTVSAMCEGEQNHYLILDV